MTERFVVRVESLQVEEKYLVPVDAPTVKEAMVEALLQTFRTHRLRKIVATAVWERTELPVPGTGENA